MAWRYILVVLTHCRRLADKQKFRECCSKATEWQTQQLEKLRELALEGKSEDLKEGSPAKKRATKDALDFEIPQTPSVTTALSEGWQCEAEADMTSPVPTSKEKIRDCMGVPQVKKKPSMAGKKKGAKKQLAKKADMPCKPKKKGKKPELSAEERARLILMPYSGTGACAIRVTQGRQILQIKEDTGKELPNGSQAQEEVGRWCSPP